MADHLVSIHGRRLGIDSIDRLLFDGQPVVASVDSSATLTIGVDGRFRTFTDSIDWANSTAATRRGAVTIAIPSGVTALAAPLHYSSRAGGRVRLEGETLTRTLSAITAVTGTTGAWSVTATLDSGTDVAVGDYVLVKNVAPGVAAPGTLSGRAPFGELRLGYFSQSSSEATTSGTTVTLSNAAAVASNTLAVGDLVVIKGEIRSVATVSGGQTFTIDAALTRDEAAGVQYWYHCRAATGTVTVSGTAVTGTNTLFTTQANVGDLILFAGYGVRRITAIDSATSITLDGAITIGSGVAFAVVTGGEQHEGCWEVTAVDGTSVTWTNKMRTAQSVPPVNNVTAGDVTVLKSVLKWTGATSGFVVADGCALDIDKVAIVGTGGSSAVGIDLRGYTSKGGGRATLGGDVGVVGFGYGARALGVGALYAGEAVFSGATVRGVDITEGARAYLNAATISGNVGIGVFVGPGAYVRLADARCIGNSSDGLRMEVGGSTWADFAYFCANGARGFHAVGATDIHVVGARINKNTSSGLYGENGLSGRGSGVMCLANVSTGITAINGNFEAGQCWVSGNSDGLSAQRGLITVLNGGITWNDGENVYADAMATVHCDTAVLLGGTYAVRALAKARVYGTGVTFGDNSSANASRVTGADVLFPSAVGLSTLAAINRRIINVGAKVGATAGWVLGDGAVDKGLMATLPASQTTATLVVPVPGLMVGDTITAFHAIGQIESAGGDVTLVINLRKHTAAAADVSDASVGTVTLAHTDNNDVVVDSTNTSVTGLTEIVAQNETFYFLITGTTDAATDIALQGVAVEVQ